MAQFHIKQENRELDVLGCICFSGHIVSNMSSRAFLIQRRRGGVSLLKVAGKAVQIHKPQVPGIHIADFPLPFKSFSASSSFPRRFVVNYRK